MYVHTEIYSISLGGCRQNENVCIHESHKSGTEVDVDEIEETYKFRMLISCISDVWHLKRISGMMLVLAQPYGDITLHFRTTLDLLASSLTLPKPGKHWR